MIFLGLAGLILIALPGYFIRLFINDPDVIRSGITCLRIISYGFVMYALGMVMVQAFNGAGDTGTPTIINLFCYWMLEIPLAYFLAIRLGYKETGVSVAIVIAESTMTLWALYLFLRGKWKLREI